MRTADRLTVKNSRTGHAETITQHDLEFTDWGFHFFCDSELDAFKAAYQYRNNQHGTEVRFAQGVQRWMVTVFNRNISPGTSR
jgi:hypothetical protein